MKIALFILVTSMAAYIAYTTPMAYKEARREIAQTVSEWPESQALQQDAFTGKIALAMPPALPLRGGK